MYDYLTDQAQAKRERFRAEIEQDLLIGQVKTDTHKSIYFITQKGVSKMQFKRQWVAALLLAGSILAATIALARQRQASARLTRGQIPANPMR
jgi:hypothetical protein